MILRERVLARLRGTRFSDVRQYGEVDTTMRVARELAEAGARDGVVVLADHQSAGRGRLGRTWQDLPGASLIASLVLRPRQLPLSQHYLVTAAVALAARQACQQLAAVEVGLKWPNDLVIGERKLAGILAEAAGGAIVVGMGLNVSAVPRELGVPAGAGLDQKGSVAGVEAGVEEAAEAEGGLQAAARVEETAVLAPVSLEEAAGHPVDREELAVAWLVSLDRWLERPAAEIAAAYREACVTLGRRVRVDLADRVLSGFAGWIDEGGRLVVVTDAGQQVAVAAGDVFHARSS